MTRKKKKFSLVGFFTPVKRQEKPVNVKTFVPKCNDTTDFPMLKSKKTLEPETTLDAEKTLDIETNGNWIVNIELNKQKLYENT